MSTKPFKLAAVVVVGLGVVGGATALLFNESCSIPQGEPRCTEQWPLLIGPVRWR